MVIDGCTKYCNREQGSLKRTVTYAWTDYRTNTETAKEVTTTPFFKKIQENRRNWFQNMNRMPCTRLARILKNYRPTGRRSRGRPLQKLLDM
jgi:hypothetical protein